MFAPLRSAFAMQFMSCNMQPPPTKAESSSMMVSPTTEHCQHMSVDAPVDDSVYPVSHTVKSCCNGDAPCSSSCHFAISASLFLQAADYSPALINTDTFAIISNALLVRELSPPSRPPLSLHS